jgi:hypothetical protein
MFSKRFIKTDSCSAKDFEAIDSYFARDFEVIDSCRTRASC